MAFTLYLGMTPVRVLSAKEAFCWKELNERVSPLTG